MAKRNIAKTAIEGGRRNRNRLEEHWEDLSERRAYRDFCQKAALDPEIDEPREDWKASHSTGRAYREFADKLSPVLRWLNAQVGRNWNDVYSEINEKFDKRTLAGRHIIDHINAWVNIDHIEPKYYKRPIYESGVYDWRDPSKNKIVGYEWIEYSYWDFEIDEKGVLVCGKGRPYGKKRCND